MYRNIFEGIGSLGGWDSGGPEAGELEVTEGLWYGSSSCLKVRVL
jgi:hypothetical protein